MVVPIPRRESRGVKIDNTKVSIQTETREKLPPAVGIVLVAWRRPSFSSRIMEGLGRTEPMIIVGTLQRGRTQFEHRVGTIRNGLDAMNSSSGSGIKNLYRGGIRVR